MDFQISCHVLRRGDGMWCCECIIPTAVGRVTVSACVPERLIRGALQRLRPMLVGSVFSDIGRAARKLARTKVIANALRQARAIAKGPLGALIPPQITQSLELVYRLQALRVRHAKGDRNATARLQLAARSRNPQVQRAAHSAVQLFGDLAHVRARAAAAHDEDEADEAA